VERTGLFLSGPGQTFHGRDRFAPIAAWLLRGEPIAELGPEIADPVRLAGEPPRRAAGELHGRVIHVDRYGNLVTDLPAAWLPADVAQAAGQAGLRVEVGGQAASHSATRFVAHYQQIPAGEAALLPGSLGTLEISLNGADLARAWGVAREDPVRVTWREDRK
jgi:S-adenosylmethionine hydrolase